MLWVRCPFRRAGDRATGDVRQPAQRARRPRRHRHPCRAPADSRNIRFDIAPYLSSADRARGSGRADRRRPSDRHRLVDLRRLVGKQPPRCVAFGRFASRQAMIGIRARLSYVFSNEPRMIDLTEDGTPSFDSTATARCSGSASGDPARQRPAAAIGRRPALAEADHDGGGSHDAGGVPALRARPCSPMAKRKKNGSLAEARRSRL